MNVSYLPLLPRLARHIHGGAPWAEAASRGYFSPRQDQLQLVCIERNMRRARALLRHRRLIFVPA